MLSIDPGFVQGGDVWMGQRSQDVALALEARPRRSHQQEGVRQLQSNGAFQAAVGPVRKPNLPHAALPEHTLQPVSTDELPRLELRRCRHRWRVESTRCGEQDSFEVGTQRLCLFREPAPTRLGR
jgi:hypothetical protein